MGLRPVECAFTAPTVCVGYWRWSLVLMNNIKSLVEILYGKGKKQNKTHQNLFVLVEDKCSFSST